MGNEILLNQRTSLAPVLAKRCWAFSLMQLILKLSHPVNRGRYRQPPGRLCWRRPRRQRNASSLEFACSHPEGANGVRRGSGDPRYSRPGGQRSKFVSALCEEYRREDGSRVCPLHLSMEDIPTPFPVTFLASARPSPRPSRRCATSSPGDHPTMFKTEFKPLSHTASRRWIFPILLAALSLTAVGAVLAATDPESAPKPSPSTPTGAPTTYPASTAVSGPTTAFHDSVAARYNYAFGKDTPFLPSNATILQRPVPKPQELSRPPNIAATATRRPTASGVSRFTPTASAPPGT